MEPKWDCIRPLHTFIKCPSLWDISETHLFIRFQSYHLQIQTITLITWRSISFNFNPIKVVSGNTLRHWIFNKFIYIYQFGATHKNMLNIFHTLVIYLTYSIWFPPMFWLFFGIRLLFNMSLYVYIHSQRTSFNLNFVPQYCFLWKFVLYINIIHSFILSFPTLSPGVRIKAVPFNGGSHPCQLIYQSIVLE